MTNSRSEDHAIALALLSAAFGDCSPKQPLRKLFESQPDFGKFEWMLTIIGLEIDLRVDIPESLSDNLKLTVDEFCRRVAALPKIDSPGYTLECLGLVAHALLSLEPPDARDNDTSASKGASTAPKRALARPARSPRPKAAAAKRVARQSTASGSRKLQKRSKKR